MKLIGINIDNLDTTTLNDKFNQVYNELREQDITLVITSNKHISTLSSLFGNYDNIYYVSDNGALVAYNNKIIEKNTFSEMEVVLILEDLLEYKDMAICVSGVNKAYLQRKDSDYYNAFLSKYEELEIVDNFEQIDDQVINFVGYVDNADAYLEKCNDVMFVESTVLDNHMISFSMEDVSSISSVAAICRKMNISKDEITYFEGTNVLDEVLEVLKKNKIS